MKKSELIPVRASPAEKETFNECADMAGISLSSWARERLRAAAKEEMTKAGKVAKFLIKQDEPEDDGQ